MAGLLPAPSIPRENTIYPELISPMLTEPDTTRTVPDPSPLLRPPTAVPGAVAAGGVDEPVAAHYGHPIAEQRALDRGRAVVDLCHRGVVTISGADRLQLLHVLSSQDLATLPPGTSTETLFLDLHGRLDFQVHLVDDGETTWMTVEPGLGASLAGWLEAMKFASRVEIADRSDDLAVVATTAPVPGWDATPCWQDPWPHIGPGGYAYTPDVDPDDHPGVDWSWYEYLVDRSALAGSNRDEQLLPDGYRWAGMMSAEALRVAAGRPRQLVDTDERSIPHELDLLRTAVHLNKGCYKGQETVARVHNLGHPPRRLVQLLLDGSVHGLPEPGADVILRPEGGETGADRARLDKARALGRVTSVGHHHEMGPIALAVIKRAVDPEAELLIREKPPADHADDHAPNGTEDAPDYTYMAATQQVLVATDAGNTVGRPTGLMNLRRQRPGTSRS
nr:folate-binding protein [Auritidibacter ignavus]